MSDNVINLSEHKQTCEDNVCQHCEWQKSTIENFVKRVKTKKVGSDEFISEVESLIGYVEFLTRRNTLTGLVDGLIEEINYLDGHEDGDE